MKDGNIREEIGEMSRNTTCCSAKIPPNESCSNPISATLAHEKLPRPDLAGMNHTDYGLL
jgi:hypothetical protein